MRFEDAKALADVEEVRRLALNFTPPDDELGEPYATHGDRFPWAAVVFAFGGTILGGLFLAVLVIRGFRWLQ